MSVFYNTKTLKEITLNKNPLREFQTIDILRLIKNRLKKNPRLADIQTNVDSISTISEAIFNKKLWELSTVYRGINFKDNQQKIDFTIGFISLEFYEEKCILESRKDKQNIYWSECADESDEKLVANIEAMSAVCQVKPALRNSRISSSAIIGRSPLKRMSGIYDSAPSRSRITCLVPSMKCSFLEGRRILHVGIMRCFF